MQGRGPQKLVVGRRPWGYAGEGPSEAGRGKAAVGICRGGALRSWSWEGGRGDMQGRGPQKPVVGRRPWGYAGEAPSEAGRGKAAVGIYSVCVQRGVWRGVCRRGCI